MIVFRRILAVILALLLFVVLAGTLLAGRANGTIADSAFHARHLDGAGVYAYVYDDLGPLAVREARENVRDPVIDFGRLEAEIVGAVRAAFPPEFLREQTERALGEIIPYLTNRRDTFAVTIPIHERLRQAGPGVKQALGTGRLPERLYDDIARDEIGKALSQARIPFGLQFTPDEILASAKRIAPPGFLQDQINRGIDSLLPYLAGDAEGFTIKVDVAPRREAAAAEIRALLGSRDLQPFVFQEVLDPMAERNIGSNLRVPFGLIVTPADVQQVLRETAGGPWLTARINEVAAATADFMTARAQTFNVVIPLAERKTAALDSVARLMERKLAQAYQAAPICTPAQQRALTPQALLDRGITCRPSGLSLDQVKALAGLTDFQAEVRRIVGAALPDTFTFAEADLRRAFGAQQSRQLDDARAWFRDGITFTEADLEEELAKADFEDQGRGGWDDLTPAARRDAIAQSQNVRDLREFRDRIRGGFAYDQDDLLDDIRDERGEEGVQDFEDFREVLGRLSGVWYGWLIVAALLIAVGALGGRNWRSKAAWSAALLAVSSLVLLVGLGIVASGAAEDEIRQSFEEELAGPDNSPLERSVLLRAQTVVLAASDDLFSGLAGTALVLTIIGALALALVLLWPRIQRWRGRGAPTSRGPAPPSGASPPPGSPP